ncbi:MAG: hypothetical protein KDC49_10520 [Saprospiraceae bacterium]|nr:hypothetical protein [Saprospiraceae bacterium]
MNAMQVKLRLEISGLQKHERKGQILQAVKSKAGPVKWSKAEAMAFDFFFSTHYLPQIK